jgi:hypothetical protein
MLRGAVWSTQKGKGIGRFSHFGAYFGCMKDESTTLYRPVGQAEFDLIRASGFKKFPPRLPHQPIFYPVLNEEYATQIARDWNTKDENSGFVGYVLRFNVRSECLSSYEIRTVGSGEHREYWIPAEDLERLNESIVGAIEVVSEFRRDCSE